MYSLDQTSDDSKSAFWPTALLLSAETIYFRQKGALIRQMFMLQAKLFIGVIVHTIETGSAEDHAREGAVAASHHSACLVFQHANQIGTWGICACKAADLQRLPEKGMKIKDLL